VEFGVAQTLARALQNVVFRKRYRRIPQTRVLDSTLSGYFEACTLSMFCSNPYRASSAYRSGFLSSPAMLVNLRGRVKKPAQRAGNRRSYMSSLKCRVRLICRKSPGWQSFHLFRHGRCASDRRFPKLLATNESAWYVRCVTCSCSWPRG